MAKKDNSSSKNVPSFQAPRNRGKWLWATVCFVVAILLSVAFFDFSPNQNPFNGQTATAQNAVGIFGKYATAELFYHLGGGAWLVPIFLLILGWILLRKVKRLALPRMLAMLLCINAASGLCAMQDTFFANMQVYNSGPGGLLGKALYDQVLRAYVGPFGSGLILSIVYLLGLIFVLTRDVGAEFDRLFESIHAWRERRAERKEEKKELRRLQKEAKAKQRAKQATDENAAAPKAAPPPAIKKFSIPRRNTEPEAVEPQTDLTAFSPPEEEETEPVDTDPIAAEPARMEVKIVAPATTRKAQINRPLQSGDYNFPPMEILNEPAAPQDETAEEEHGRQAETLVRTLSEFGVDVTLGEIHVGPVITRYEIYPAPGVRVEKITSLDKNIALGMRAQSVRILAPVPGKGCVGVEVPNRHPTPVGIREILESEDWVGANAEIPIALGRDVSGAPLISDLTRMPHLLIAGATGSGKTVCINSIITSLLYHASPDDLRFIMVDPKIVEMKIFNDLPHMLIPVVTDPKKVPAALKWLLAEMENRYQIFAKVGVRNIAGFNGRKKIEDETPAAPSEDELAEGREDELLVPRDSELEIPDKMPYIVVIIDELADLMMVAPADIETGIARLAQLARAAGIHLIIATQRPSVNVITGVIKANLPCRIAFQVASKVDSRTILDSGGADQLIGRGDMLFSPPGTSKLIRSQGAFVSDDEINSIVDFLKKNGPPEYAQEVQNQIDSPEDQQPEEAEQDEMYPQALDVLRNTKRASTSMLQRRLRIGYNRAARLMEIMEARGIVGPENGSSPREILVDLDTL